MDSASLPQVSVILPILNEARDLVASISAILRQDYPPGFEVILALGPSKDDTNRIATELAAKDARIILVDNPTGRTANGLNAAISKSRYPIISRIDGHAEVSNTYLRDAVEILLKTQAVNDPGDDGIKNAEPLIGSAERLDQKPKRPCERKRGQNSAEPYARKNNSPETGCQ